MAHYSLLDENNVVTEMITGVDENIVQIDIDGTEVGGSTEAWENFYGNLKGQVCKRTSINTVGGKRKDPITAQIIDEVGFRKNTGVPGMIYNEEIDGFIPPKTDDSFILDEEIGNWVPLNNNPPSQQ